MSALLWIIVLTPFAGALTLAVFGASVHKKAAGTIGCLTVGISWICAVVLGVSFSSAQAVSVPWIDISWFKVDIGLRLDALSLAWLEIVTFVGLLIHLYASQSMYSDDDYPRFFCYMNLFVGSMLTLVVADNLLLLYLGWEGVGLCSYLLIGHWYKDLINCDSARKAFIVTRIGDTALAIALFMLAWQYRTLDIQTIIHGAPTAAVTIVTLLILGGAVGKSAQIPLHTWLPDAMAGPTPVSALIHAATMVTAGVYLIARLGNIFMQSHVGMSAVAIVGTITLLYAGLSALGQSDLKRVLAYSTISQIGYMFLALGVGAWTAAVFHFVTHAFFKALLFLAGGIVIDAQDDEHDILKMGGLKNALPIAFWTFLIGSASLSAVPFITAGFYSKEAILGAVNSSGARWLLIGGLVGTLLTATYTFRMIFTVFFGEQKIPVSGRPGSLMTFAVVTLSVLSIIGFVGWPMLHFGDMSEQILIIVSAMLVIIGIYSAYIYASRRQLSEAFISRPVGKALHWLSLNGFGFDWIYEHAIIIPLKSVAYVNRHDFIDAFYTGLATAARGGENICRLLQTGRVRNYTAALVVGAIIIVFIIAVR